MTERTKKILLIIAFILVVFLIGFLIFYLFFYQIPIVPPLPTNQPPLVNGFPPINENINGVPVNINEPANINVPIPVIPEPTIPPGPVISDVANGGLTSYTILESNYAYNTTLAANGKDLIYFDKTDGFIYRLVPETGQKQKFNNQSFNNVSNIIWSNDQNKAIFEYPDGGNVVFDFETNTSVTLPSHWKEFDFSPTGDKIVFKNMMLDPEERYICTSDTNGGDFTEIERLGDEDEDVYITWSPNNQYIALYRESLDASRSEIYPIGLNNENFVSLRVEGRNPTYIWSPSGNLMLYSVFNSRSEFKPLLWVVSSDPTSLGTGRKSLGVYTWADKCVFATETIVYCAVPRTLAVGAGYLPSLADTVPYDFYRLNLATGNKSLIAQPIFSTQVTQLFVSADQSYIFWTERDSGQLIEIKLK